MSLTQFIKRAAKSQYVRQLVVRAVEDGCVFLVMAIGIWLVCTVVGGIFRLLGVA